MACAAMMVKNSGIFCREEYLMAKIKAPYIPWYVISCREGLDAGW
jgi:hypothetical protein